MKCMKRMVEWSLLLVLCALMTWFFIEAFNVPMGDGVYQVLSSGMWTISEIRDVEIRR